MLFASGLGTLVDIKVQASDTSASPKRLTTNLSSTVYHLSQYNTVFLKRMQKKISLLVNTFNSHFKAANNCRQSCKCSAKYSKALIATTCCSFWKEIKKHSLDKLHYLSYYQKNPKPPISTLHYTTHLSTLEACNTSKCMKYIEILKVGQVRAVLLIAIKQRQCYLPLKQFGQLNSGG